MNNRGILYAAVGAAIAYLALRRYLSPATGAPVVVTRNVSPPGQTNTVTKIVNVPGPATTQTKIVTQSAPPPPVASLLTGLGKSLAAQAAPVAPEAVKQTLTSVGGFVSQGDTGILQQGNLRDAFSSVSQDIKSLPIVGQLVPRNAPLQPVASKIGDTIDSVGHAVGALGPVAGVFGTSVALQGWSSNTKQQTQIFGKSALSTAQFAVGAVPIVGVGLSAALGALAGTGTGAKVVTAVGKGIDQGYQAQKDLFNGDFNALGHIFGGSTHKERVNNLNMLIEGRLAELATKGGPVTAADISVFHLGLAEGLGADFNKAWVDSLQAGKALPTAGLANKYSQTITNNTEAATSAKIQAAAQQSSTYNGQTFTRTPQAVAIAQATGKTMSAADKANAYGQSPEGIWRSQLASFQDALAKGGLDAATKNSLTLQVADLQKRLKTV